MALNNIVRVLSNDIISELYAVAAIRPEIMVVNWLAHAYEYICNEATKFIPQNNCDSIDVLFKETYMSDLIKEYVKINPLWLKLHDWHLYHSNRAKISQFADEYEVYLDLPKLELQHYTLG